MALKDTAPSEEDKEDTPLLTGQFTPEDTPKNGILQRLFPTGFKVEFRETWTIAWPTIFTVIFQYYFQPISIMFAGKLGTIEVDAVALSNTIINVFGSAVVSGLTTACDTVFSQAYGRGHYKMIGIQLQRSLIVLSMALMLCLTLHLNMGGILAAIGQNPEVSKLVGRYLTVFSPGLVSLFLWVALRKYTQCQNVVKPHLFIGLIAHIVHAILQYIFLFELNLGIDGSAMAQAIAYVILFILTLAYIFCSKFHKKTWPGWNRRCLIEWGVLIRLGLYGFAMTTLEFVAYEGCTILAGYLGTVQQASQAILFQMDILLLSATLGLGTTASIRCGQHLGAGRPLEAINATRVIMLITVIYAAITGTITALLRHQIATLFSTDAEVVNTVANLIPVVALYLFSDSITSTGRGVFRGCGKQRLGTVITFIAYYILSLPVGVTLMFTTDIGILGVWWSYWAALTFMAIVMTYLMNFRFDWNKMSEEARKEVDLKKQIEQKEQIEGKENESWSTPSIQSEEEFLGPGDIPRSAIYKCMVSISIFTGILIIGIIIRISLPEIILPQAISVNATKLSDSDVFNVTTMSSSYLL